MTRSAPTKGYDDDMNEPESVPASKNQTAKGPEGLRAVDRTVTLLLTLSKYPSGISLADIARETGITLTTTHRILSTLRKGGLARETPTGLQALGVTSLVLGNSFLEGVDVRSEAHPILRSLRDETNETCHLGVLASSNIVYIDKLDSHQRVRMFSSIGGTNPALTTAIGRSILAYSSDEVVEKTLRAAKNEGVTYPSDEELREGFRAVQNSGYSADLEENEPGICCVGAPVFDHNGRPVAGISLSTPTSRFNHDAVDEIGKNVRAKADTISAALGYAPQTPAD